MLFLGFLAGLLASPAHCPKDVGQIRWDGLKFAVAGQTVKIKGSLWDRDRNGRPSHGDLMRIDSATRRGQDLAIDETWVVLRGQLARSAARHFRRNKPTAARCESRFHVTGIPAFSTGHALTRYLTKVSKAGKPDRESIIRDGMQHQVEQTCKEGTNTPRKTLTKLLFSYGMRRHSDLGRRRVARIAREVAQENALKCGHLDLKSTNLTF